MGVYCEIKLFKPSDGAFIPGSVISGVIKYAVDEVTVFNKITLSLKGSGYVIITDETERREQENVDYRGYEDYVDIDNVIHSNEKGVPLPIGSYEIPFSFRLPQDIPGSLDYNERNASYWVISKISYYVRIKFDRPGFLKFAKRFRKEFTVVSGIKPRLSIEPVVYGEQSKLFQLFGSKDSIVNIKATIENSVIQPGEQVGFNCEISNDTNLTLKGVETKIIEIYTFKCKQHPNVNMTYDVACTDSKTGAVKSGNTQKYNVVISIPSNKTSLEHSQIVTREYFVCITAIVPFPHQNVELKIPIQVGYKTRAVEDVQNVQQPVDVVVDEPPPSYWEVMGEDDEKRDDKK